jgi:energy-converting hydrogenase A subunit M
MTEWLYEQDLVSQKYRILIAHEHDQLIRALASDLGVGVQELRRYMIEHIDMILLENLPARYKAAVAAGADADDPVARELRPDIFSRSIPLIPTQQMDAILKKTKERIEAGSPLPEAVAAGKAMIREVILR